AAGPGLCRPHVAKPPALPHSQAVCHQHPRLGSRAGGSPLRVQQPLRREVRDDGLSARHPRFADSRQCPGRARVHPGPRLSGRRPHDLRRSCRGRGMPRRRGPGTAALLSRPIQSASFTQARMTPIPLSTPAVDDEIKAAVLAAVESRQYILGPECRAFEDELARFVGSRYAILTSSATAALWMALKAFGVKSSDEVLVPSHTAFPTIEAICFAGAQPVFVDIDDSYTVDLKDAAAKVSPRTVGCVPVHIYG